jgi:hypothetical protein
MHGDLTLGIGWVGEGMQLDRRAVHLAEPADQLSLGVRLYVCHDDLLAGQRLASGRAHDVGQDE